MREHLKILILFLSFLNIAVANAQIEGAIDLHVHSAPDSVPRALTAIETAQIAKRYGMRAVLFKNHYFETATVAYLVSQIVPEVGAYGGIALNRSVGGLNTKAVEQMAAMSGGHGRIVWMPTVDAAQGPFASTVDPDDILTISRNGVLLPEVITILDLIAELDLALATGHSSPQDSLLLVRAARERNIDRIVITHPLEDLSLPPEIRQEIIDLGALLEFPIGSATPIGSTPYEEFLAQIHAAGPQNVILSTDLGQAVNPLPAAGFVSGVERLIQDGFTQEEIDWMIRRNPARILGIGVD
jgi:hypothetical protein